MNASAQHLRAPAPSNPDELPSRRLHLVRPQEVSSSVWTQPTSQAEPMTTDRARVVAGPEGQLAPDVEAALIATLTRPLEPGESHQTGNMNRERELYALLARLDVMQAFQLGRRLDAERANDPLVAAFRRLVVERRQRVRAFLRDARRRASVGVR